MNEYVKIKAKTADGKTIIRFAEKIKEGVYHLVDKQGVRTNHYFLGKKEDVIWERKAFMNNHYCELELRK